MKLKTYILLVLAILPACVQNDAPRPQQAFVVNGTLYAPLEGARRPRQESVVRPLNYPREAEEKHIEGFVDFEFTIAPDGSVIEPRITREEPANFGFAQAAAQVFGRWKFPPDIVNGVPVSTPGRFRFAFILAK